MEEVHRLISWLNGVYAMQRALAEVLRRHAKDAEGPPEARARIERHIGETREQAEIVRGRIETLGDGVSGVKSAFADVFGAMQGMGRRGTRWSRTPWPITPPSRSRSPPSGR
ncbi:hypothetical protein GCM10027294_48080 [Marinactinospora endophytica]